MNFWEAHDRAQELLSQKIIQLTEEFDGMNKLGRKNYNQRLDSFLKRRVRRESNFLTNVGMVKTVSAIYNQVYTAY